jgi:Zn-finger nucleic acid-binding protein
MSDQILHCPEGHGNLVLEGFWKHPRHRCDTCGGQALAERDLLEMLGRRDRPKLAPETSASGTESTLPCARDGRALRPLAWDEVAFGLCESCGSAWVSREEFQKLAARKAASDSERAPRTDYVAVMASRRRLAYWLAVPLICVGFLGGLMVIVAEGYGRHHPLASVALFACFAAGVALMAAIWRCPRCRKWLTTAPGADGEPGFDLDANECRHCGTRLR